MKVYQKNHRKSNIVDRISPKNNIKVLSKIYIEIVPIGVIHK